MTVPSYYGSRLGMHFVGADAAVEQFNVAIRVLGGAHIVGHRNDSLSVFGDERIEDAEDLPAHLGIERAGRLIADDHTGGRLWAAVRGSTAPVSGNPRSDGRPVRRDAA